MNMRTAALLACAVSLATPVPAEPLAPGSAIEAPGPQGPLAGTLLRAEQGPGPVALIIPGSGPTDRDGNNPLGVRAASYRLLAEALGAQGVSSVRIDKRGMFASAGAVADANAVTIGDYVADTAAWVKVMREQTGAPCVWLIGHSEGGLVALAAAQEVEGLCGLVLIAAPGRPLGDVIKAQLRANPANAPLIEAADSAIDSLTAGRKVDVAPLPPPLQAFFNPAVQGYLIDVFARDPARLAAETKLPLLIVQGGKDIQVPVEDAERLKAANAGAQLSIFPEANHVLKDIEGDSRALNQASYLNPDLPLAKGLAEAIAAFIRR